MKLKHHHCSLGFATLLQLDFENSEDFSAWLLIKIILINLLPKCHLMTEINCSFVLRSVAKPLLGI